MAVSTDDLIDEVRSFSNTILEDVLRLSSLVQKLTCIVDDNHNKVEVKAAIDGIASELYGIVTNLKLTLEG